MYAVPIYVSEINMYLSIYHVLLGEVLTILKSVEDSHVSVPMYQYPSQVSAT